MIVDGWLDWAERMPGRTPIGPGFNVGTNDVRGLVFHSAEGFAPTMLSKTSQWGYYSAEYPWHLSNLLDGRLIQHHSFYVRCWHGSAFNQSYVGMENEGLTPENSPQGPLLTEGQINNAVRVAEDLGAWKRWAPRRPVSLTDLGATLYEHWETVRFGGSATQCPSRRIPWDEIMRRLDMPEVPTKEEEYAALISLGQFLRLDYHLADLSDRDKEVIAYIVNQIPGLPAYIGGTA